MHLHKTSQSRLVAELTQEDLYGYKVSFEEMRMENEQTVQLLHDILLRAKAKLGWTLPTAKLLRVDVLPGAGGGCIVLFSAEAHEKRLRVKSENRTLLLEISKTTCVFSAFFAFKAFWKRAKPRKLFRNSARFAARRPKRSPICASI